MDSREDIVRVIATEVVDSAFGFLPSQATVLRETASKLTEFLGPGRRLLRSRAQTE